MDTLTDGRDPGFWWAGNELIDNGEVARMGVSAFAVFCVCLRHSKKTTFSDSQSDFHYLQEKIGLNEQDLSEAINRLVELEYLKEGAIALPDMSKHTSDWAEED